MMVDSIKKRVKPVVTGGLTALLQLLRVKITYN